MLDKTMVFEFITNQKVLNNDSKYNASVSKTHRIQHYSPHNYIWLMHLHRKHKGRQLPMEHCVSYLRERSLTFQRLNQLNDTDDNGEYLFNIYIRNIPSNLQILITKVYIVPCILSLIQLGICGCLCKHIYCG